MKSLAIKKLRVFSILAILCSCLLVLAAIPGERHPLESQISVVWMKTYGGVKSDKGYFVQPTSDGGFILIGETNSFGSGDYDIWLLKINEVGDTIWTRTYGGKNHDWGEAVVQTSDSGFLIVGGTKSFGSGGTDVWLIRTNSSGDTLWTRTFGGKGDDWAEEVTQTADGEFIIPGWTNSTPNGDFDALLIKYDASGNLVWSRTYGGSRDDGAKSVALTDDGGFFVAGLTKSFGAGSSDVWIIRTNQSGDTLWTRTFGGTGFDMAFCVSQTFDKGFAVAGRVQPSNQDYGNLWILRFSSLGDTLWTRTYGGKGYDLGTFVHQASDGDLLITGSTDSYGSGSNDLWLLRTNSKGDTLWTRTFGGPASDFSFCVRELKNRDLVLAGYTESFGAGDADACFLRIKNK